MPFPFIQIALKAWYVLQDFDTQRYLFVQGTIHFVLLIVFTVKVLAETLVEVGAVVDPILPVAASRELDRVVSAHRMAFRDLLQEQSICRFPAPRSAAPRTLHRPSLVHRHVRLLLCLILTETL